jgi:hypothetical protein
MLLRRDRLRWNRLRRMEGGLFDGVVHYAALSSGPWQWQWWVAERFACQPAQWP